MRLQRRLMKPTDAEHAVALFATDPGVEQRYGALLRGLPSVWIELLKHGGLNAVVVEDLDDLGRGIVAIGVTTFVSDDFLQSYKSVQKHWMGAELLLQLAAGKQPILTSSALREANSGKGLNLMVWTASSQRHTQANESVADNVLSEAYVRGHAGFQIKEIVMQPSDRTRARLLLQSGMLLWNSSYQQYVSPSEGELNSLLDKPFIMGMPRTWASPPIWLARQFYWAPPRIGFAAGEQRLLRAAILQGLTDEGLSHELQVSISTIKKTWRTLMERVALRMPDLFSASFHATDAARGKERRGKLLAYVQQHPEELRPYDRKRLAASTCQ